MWGRDCCHLSALTSRLQIFSSCRSPNTFWCLNCRWNRTRMWFVFPEYCINIWLTLPDEINIEGNGKRHPFKNNLIIFLFRYFVGFFSGSEETSNVFSSLFYPLSFYQFLSIKMICQKGENSVKARAAHQKVLYLIANHSDRWTYKPRDHFDENQSWKMLLAWPAIIAY